jgi:hypothetical protein
MPAWLDINPMGQVVRGVRHAWEGPSLYRSPLPLWFPSHRGKPGLQADVAQLVERNLAKVEVASSSLVVRSERSPVLLGLHGGLAERRGNGLQIRLHGFKSRTHL